jgi:hypothetical protein
MRKIMNDSTRRQPSLLPHFKPPRAGTSKKRPITNQTSAFALLFADQTVFSRGKGTTFPIVTAFQNTTGVKF